ncbi:hypothetical protein GIB67_025722 [Kingdonia uniflora]|uniref:Cytochrome P450 n=1 Tax=Kingdonia uniflora TaxID=39325 RepID=A0A7J7KW94_9MAGN|nr:hypothetical protein GIB67_025722 [Kingdonia uniflora]
MVEVWRVQQWLERLAEAVSNNITLSLVILVLYIFYFFKLNGNRSRNLNLPPSPPKLPIIGNLHQLGDHPHRSFRDLSRKYGPMMLLHLGHAKTLIVSSPDIAREITTTHDTVFASRPFLTAARMFMYGCTDLTFAPYGDYWKQVKKVYAQELFSVNKVNSFRHIREEEMALMIEKISSSCLLQTPADLTSLIRNAANNLTCRCGIGIKRDGNSRFGEVAKEVVIELGAFAYGDIFPSLRWMDVLTGFRRRKLFKKVDSYLKQLIQDRVNQSKADEEEKDILDHLLQAQKDNKLGIDNIKALLINVFLGGDDAATTSEWAIAELFNKPSAMKKAQEEVRRVVGAKAKVHEEDIHQMEYLKLVVKETLRLHAPSPLLLPRYTSVGANVKGYDIPPNTTVLINVWAFQTDPEMWDNPEEFIPERFSNGGFDYKSSQNYQYLPFGSGRRSCPAISFALAIIEPVLANLLFHFDWKLPSDLKEFDMTEEFGSFVTKKTPIQLVPVFRPS